MKNKIKIILIVLLVVMQAITFASGGSRNGTGGASQLLIPVGARGIGLNGANISSLTGLDALYWNPAGLSRGSQSVEASFSYMSHIADIGINYAAISVQLNSIGSLAFAIKSLSMDDIPVTTVENPDGTGQTYNPQLMTMGLTFAKNLSDRVSVGITANLISETLNLVSTTGISFNLGVMYSGLAGVDGLSFAMAMKNLGPQMKYGGSGLNIQAEAPDLTRPIQYYKIDPAPFDLPSSFEIGLAYKPVISGSSTINLSSSFQNNNFSSDQYKIGAEYCYNDLLFIRGGYTFAPEYEAGTFLYRYTVGFGLKYNIGNVDVKFDYAYRDVKYFDSSHMFGVTLSF
ncbi:MAG: PorV/PorQ family protein [Ignavibacteriales bacterium]|nr:PorV/PorQ family protein [Ignavibacteriales bacterium]